jgi:hypothetical protein
MVSFYRLKEDLKTVEVLIACLGFFYLMHSKVRVYLYSYRHGSREANVPSTYGDNDGDSVRFTLNKMQCSEEGYKWLFIHVHWATGW